MMTTLHMMFCSSLLSAERKEGREGKRERGRERRRARERERERERERDRGTCLIMHIVHLHNMTSYVVTMTLNL